MVILTHHKFNNKKYIMYDNIKMYYDDIMLTDNFFMVYPYLISKVSNIGFPSTGLSQMICFPSGDHCGYISIQVFTIRQLDQIASIGFDKINIRGCVSIAIIRITHKSDPFPVRRPLRCTGIFDLGKNIPI